MTQATWRVWNLTGLTFDKLHIGNQVSIEVQASDCSLILTLDGPFQLQDVRTTHELYPFQPQTLSPLLPLINQPLARFSVSNQGPCKLFFTHGRIIQADGDWRVKGTGSLASASASVSATKAANSSEFVSA